MIQTKFSSKRVAYSRKYPLSYVSFSIALLLLIMVLPASALSWNTDSSVSWLNTSLNNVTNYTNLIAGFSQEYAEDGLGDWTGGDGVVLDSSIKKNGSYSFKHIGTTGISAETQKSLGQTVSSPFSVSFDVYASGFAGADEDRRISIQCSECTHTNSISLVFLNTGGIFSLYNHDGTLVKILDLNKDQWYNVKLDVTTGADATYDIYINNTLILSGLGTRGTVASFTDIAITSNAAEADDILYIDNLRFWYPVVGTAIIDYDTLSGNTTQIDINATSRDGSNYTAFYKQNESLTWTEIGSPNSTGNQSISLTPNYRHTDLKIEFYGIVNTSEISKISYFYEVVSNISAEFISPTLTNNSITTNNYVESNVSIWNASNLSSILFNWNGTNYSFYDDNLIAAYNFNNYSAIGDNATHVVDISKYGNNGTITDATYNTSGRFGSSLYIDTGNTDIVTIPNSVSLNSITNNLTVEAWVKIYENINDGTIVRRGSADAGERGWTLITDDLTAPDQFVFGVRRSDDSNWVFANSTGAYLYNRWYHVVGVFNGTHLQVYQDGVADGASAAYTGSIQESTTDMWIGGIPGSGTYTLNSDIDEVRIYNRSLSADEISKHYISEMQKFNSTQYYLYNNISGLSIGNYNYTVYANSSSSTNQTENRYVQISLSSGEYIPPIPVSLTLTQGNFWINHTWQAGSGNITEFYNVSVNGSWTNGTTQTYMNNSVGPHGWSNISVWAFNSSGNGSLSLTAASNNTQLQNNKPSAPTLTTNLGMSETDHTPIINFTKGTDLDGDTVTTYIYVDGNNPPTTQETFTTANNTTIGITTPLLDGITYYVRARSWDGTDWSGYSDIDTFRMAGSAVPFTFSNITLSETQIYQSSGVEDITVDINSTLGTISSATVTITYLSVDFIYAMSQGSGDTWTYSFKTSATGTYTVKEFNATDSASNTDGDTWGTTFTVVPVVPGGSSGATAPNITATSTPAPAGQNVTTSIPLLSMGNPISELNKAIIKTATIPENPTLKWIFVTFMTLFGVVLCVGVVLVKGQKVGKFSKPSALVLGVVLIGLGLYLA